MTKHGFVVTAANTVPDNAVQHHTAAFALRPNALTIPPCPAVSPSFKFLHSEPPLPYKDHFFLARHMADRSAPARFQELFEAALQVYEKRTGIRWTDYPLAERLQRCHSVEEMTTLLRGQAQAFGDFRESDRLMKTIETTVSILSPLSFATCLADDVTLVRQKVLMICFTSDRFYRHYFHRRRQYTRLSVFCLTYESCTCSCVDDLLTST